VKEKAVSQRDFQFSTFCFGGGKKGVG